MNFVFRLLFVCTAMALVSPGARAQILFSAPQAITGSDNIITAGAYVDALQTAPGKLTVYTIGTNIFNVPVVDQEPRDPSNLAAGYYNASEADNYFSIAPVTSYLGGAGDSFNGTFTTGNSTDNAIFGNVLAQTAYTEGSEGVTIRHLTAGHVYEVQVFKSADYSPDTSRNTSISGANTVELDASSFTTGIFTAVGTTSMFTFNVGVGGNYGEANALVLRDITPVPEPSTWAMLLGGLSSLCFVFRARRRHLL